ncbi:MAG: hypothetical protein LBI72_08770 [Flavobacteriaceae bacterium]|jgi:hypothetical protein|nr:hypothetical protein [Flavobacteriaceae bacterium]
MKKILLTVLLGVGISGSVFAQKLNISKSVVYFGKNNAVAKVEIPTKGTFIYTDVEGNKIFQLVDQEGWARNGKYFHLVEVTDLKSNQKNDILYKEFGFVFSKEAQLFNLITQGDNKLVNEQGIDVNALKVLMAQPKLSMNVEIQRINDSIQAVITSGNKILQQKNITIGDAGEILEAGTSVGIIKAVKDKDNATGYDFHQKDAKGIALAKWRTGGVVSMYDNNRNLYYRVNSGKETMLTYDLKQYNLSDSKKESGTSTPLKNQELVKELLAILYANGVDIAKVTTKDIEEMVAIAKDNGNLKGAKGYVIKEDGTKLEGELWIDFVSEDVGNVVSLQSYGKRVTVQYKDEKGKNKKESFKAGDKVKFVAFDKDNRKLEYEGFVQENGNKSSNFLNKMAIGATFHVKIAESGKLSLYYNQADRNYALKLADKEVGFIITDNPEEVILERLREYLGCNAITIEGLQYFKKEGLMEIVNRYGSQCK